MQEGKLGYLKYIKPAVSPSCARWVNFKESSKDSISEVYILASLSSQANSLCRLTPEHIHFPPSPSLFLSSTIPPPIYLSTRILWFLQAVETKYKCCSSKPATQLFPYEMKKKNKENYGSRYLVLHMVAFEAGRGELAVDYNTCFGEFQSFFLFLE